MITSNGYLGRQPTPEEIQTLMRQAHAERAQAIRNLFRALFRRKPAAEHADRQPALAAVAYH